MKAFELKDYIGKRCSVTYLNKQGDLTLRRLDIQDLAYVPLYGDYLIGDVEDICLDRIKSVHTV